MRENVVFLKVNKQSETKRFLVTKIILALFLSLFIFFNHAPNLIAQTAYTGMRDITSMELVADMGVGWNLGNSLDTKWTDETYWGNPVTTKAMIDEVAAQGFKTLRVPVTWEYHIGDAPDYTIEKARLDRVEEIANYGFDNNMYVIINIHHDDSWIVPTYSRLEEAKDQLGKVWTQIANRFKDYGDYLIFETLNEPRLEGSAAEWSGGTAEGRDCVNQYHKVSVDAIRATGGNNATRHIMVSPYGAAALDVSMNSLVIPNNDERVIVSLHSYSPYEFCQKPDGTSSWGSIADKAAMDQMFDKIQSKFVTNGRAVILGEWGATNRNNTAARATHAGYYVQSCKKRGICPIIWDNGVKDAFAIFNRKNISWFYPEILDAIMANSTYTTTTEAIQINEGALPNLFNYQLTPNGQGFRVKYTLNKISNVSIKVVDIKGVEIKTIVPNIKQSKGQHEIDWNGKNNAGVPVLNGIYFLSFMANNKREVKKTMLVR